jgi:hypothetical protein
LSRSPPGRRVDRLTPHRHFIYSENPVPSASEFREPFPRRFGIPRTHSGPFGIPRPPFRARVIVPEPFRNGSRCAPRGAGTASRVTDCFRAVPSRSEQFASGSELFPSCSRAVSSRFRAAPSCVRAVPSCFRAVPSCFRAVPRSSRAVPSRSEPFPIRSETFPRFPESREGSRIAVFRPFPAGFRHLRTPSFP